ncbi:phosphoadenosine phosphosulfate reductase family protein [Streptomyces sp. NPDC058171]
MCADESAARRHLYTRGGRRDGTITRTDETTAYGPIWNWTTDDVWAYIARNRLPVNPVDATLRRPAFPNSSTTSPTSSTATASPGYAADGPPSSSNSWLSSGGQVQQFSILGEPRRRPRHAL